MDQELVNALLELRRGIVSELTEVVTDKVDGAVRELRDEMVGHLDAIYHRLMRLETEYEAIAAALDRLEPTVAEMENRIARGETDVADLWKELAAVRVDLSALGGRVVNLEKRIAWMDQTKLEQQLVLRTELADLEARMAEMNARLAQVEAQIARASAS